jgi:hypothetical protein
LGGAIAAETNEPLAIESRHIARAKMSSQHVECRGLGAERGLAYIAHVVDMKVDEFAEGLQARYTGLGRRLTAIDLALRVGCPASCVVSEQEGLADLATFATDLGHVRNRTRVLCRWPFFRVCSECTERSKRGEKDRILA